MVEMEKSFYKHYRNNSVRQESSMKDKIKPFQWKSLEKYIQNVWKCFPKDI